METNSGKSQPRREAAPSLFRKADNEMEDNKLA